MKKKIGTCEKKTVSKEEKEKERKSIRRAATDPHLVTCARPQRAGAHSPQAAALGGVKEGWGGSVPAKRGLECLRRGLEHRKVGRGGGGGGLEYQRKGVDGG